jgi:hypothetical protein
MKWKYIGNRTGDATKGEQYIVEADELTEKYMKEMPYPQFVKVSVVQPPSPRNNFMNMRTGDIIKICNPYYEMAYYSHPGFVPVKE